MTIVSFDCPHCRKNLINRNTALPFEVDNPVKICPFCGGEYIMPRVLEWSIISPLLKFYYIFLYNLSVIPAFFMLIYLSAQKWLLFFIFLVVWIGFSVVRFQLVDSINAKESYKRTQGHPEYIQKLSDMGYWYIDFRIDPYYK